MHETATILLFDVYFDKRNSAARSLESLYQNNHTVVLTYTIAEANLVCAQDDASRGLERVQITCDYSGISFHDDNKTVVMNAQGRAYVVYAGGMVFTAEGGASLAPVVHITLKGFVLNGRQVRPFSDTREFRFN